MTTASSLLEWEAVNDLGFRIQRQPLTLANLDQGGTGRLFWLFEAQYASAGIRPPDGQLNSIEMAGKGLHAPYHSNRYIK